MNRKHFKILSKRQMQRIVKKNINLLTQKSFLTTNENDSSSNILLISNTNTFFSERATVANAAQQASVNADQATSTFSTRIEFDSNLRESVSLSENSDCVNSFSSSQEHYLNNQLREWSFKNNISCSAVSELLGILNPHFKFLPKDYRTLLKTPRFTDTIGLNNGEMIYLGILNQLLFRLSGGFKKTVTKILLQINIDGLPLFKSSNIELYPILGLCPDLNDERPFLIACFSGTGKPDPLDGFLRPFINEFKQLNSCGFTFKDNHYNLDINFFICDAPARAYLKCILGHTSKHGCEKCKVVGKYKNHRISFAGQNQISVPIVDNDFYSSDQVFIKTVSPLLEMNVKLVTQFPLDPMHLVYLGVVKRILINYYIEGKAPYKLSQKLIITMNQKMSRLKQYQPTDFVRKCRSFKDIKRWKATEFRSFLLYHGVLVLHEGLTKTQFEHFLLLHCAIFIFSNEHFLIKYINSAETFLKKFVALAENILGEEFVVYNVHSLIHLVEDVRNYGAISNYSCFPFENYLGWLKQKIRSKKNILQQVHSRFVEFNKQKEIYQNHPSENANFKPLFIYNEEYNANGILMSYNCKKICYKNVILSRCSPDNCIITKSNKVCLIKKIYVTADNTIIITFEGLSFSLNNLYSRPMPSSELNIYYFKGFSENNAVTFSQDCILSKGFLMPHKNGYAFFPLNHLIF